MSTDSGRQVELETAVFESMAEGVLLLEGETITFLDSTAVDLFDVDRDEQIGASLNHVLPTDSSLQQTITAAREAASERTFEAQVNGRNLKGTVHPADGTTVVVVREIATEGHEEDTDGDSTVSKRERQTVLERLHGVASEVSYTRDEKIHEMLEIVTDYLGVEYGFVTRFEDDTQEIIHSVGTHPDLQTGGTAPLAESYCQYTLKNEGQLAVENAAEEGWEQRDAYERFELECYIGVVLSVEDEEYGTVCFAGSQPNETGFDDEHRTVVEVLAEWLTLMLEREASERELRHQQAFMEGLLNSLPDPVYAYDDDGTLLHWNERLETVTGYDEEEIRTKSPTDFVVEADRDKVASMFEDALAGANVSVEATLDTNNQAQVPFEFSGAPLFDDDDNIVGVTGVGRDITEQSTYRDRLSRILETTRSLMQARDRQHVGELAANAATELLDQDFSVFRLYDGDAGTLEPIAVTDPVESTIGDRPTYDVGEGYPGSVFASGEPRVVSDLTQTDNDVEYGDARSAIYYPVGVHGTMTVASREPDAFNEMDRQVLALLATSAAGACMRAKRMEEIREARQHTERVLDRVNGLVQNTVEVLVQARTREELEAGVVSELAATDPYTFAWLGQPDVATETLVPSAWEGEATLPIEGRSFDLSRSNETVAKAYSEGMTQVVTDTEMLHGPLADVVDGSGVEALVVIPLVYKDATYGVLSVCADDETIFDDRERVVLDALGRAVANAINAVERGRILDATEIIELEFSVTGSDLLFNRLAEATDSRVEAVGTDYRSDGRVRLYLSVEDVDPDAFAERAKQDHEVLEFTGIVDHDSECLVELVVEESLLAVLAEYGAVTRSVVAENGAARFTVELPYEAEARELFELVEQRHPGTELLGYHERERAVETRQDFKAALSERLTDRQETALRTAFLGGFFDWPREVDGNELAEAMDISRPTYHQHLRAAQAKVFEELFD
jgi:PAS domain S-box-containing protein